MSVTRAQTVATDIRSNTVLAPEQWFWGPFFVRPKKIILTKRQGKIIKHKLLKMIQVTVLLHTDHLFLFTKTKTAPRAPKLFYFDEWAPQLSAQVTLVPSGAGMVCFMYVCSVQV